MKLVQRKAWAIDAGGTAALGHDFIGHAWFGWPKEMWTSGLTICLFKTRKLAKEHLAKPKRSFPKAKVVRVRILVETLK